MKALLSIIRWKFVIPAGIFLAGIIVFFVLLFDPLLTRGLEKAGGKINKARVDIHGLKTKFFKGRLTIKRIEIANPDSLMKNRLEMGPLAFQLDLGHVLRKRVIVPEATIDGIKLDTDRKVSGRLSRPIKVKKKKKDKKPSASAKLVEKYKGRFDLTLKNVKLGAQEKVEFDKEKTQLYQKGKQLEDKAKNLPNDWETRVKKVDVEGRLKKVEGDLKSIKDTPTKGVEAVLAIPQALQKLKQSQADLNQINSDLKNLKSDIKKEIDGLKGNYGELKSAKQADLNDLMGRFNLDFADPRRLAEGLIGGAVLDRAEKVLRLVELAREHMPAKKAAPKTPPKDRAQGMDIPFPKPADPPRLWLKIARLSGQVQEIKAEGSLNHLNSSPSRLGLPTSLVLKGQKGPQLFDLEIKFDHTEEVAKDGFSFRARGLQVKKMIQKGILAKSLSEGESSARLGFLAMGDSQIGGNFEIILGNLKFDDAKLFEEAGIPLTEKLSSGDEIKASLVRNLARSIEKMPQVQAEGKLTGSWDDPDLKFSSNLDSVLAQVIKESVGNALKEERKKLEEQLDNLLKDQTAKLNQEIAKLDQKLNGQLAGLETQVKQKLEDAAGIKLSPSSPGSSDNSSQTPAKDPLKNLKIDDIKNIFK